MNRSRHYLEVVASMIPGHKFGKLLELGEEGLVAPFTPKEQKLIKLVTRLVKPQRKQCFSNSQQVILTLGDPFEYVEGFYSRDEVPVPVEHGWLRLNGKVVDITPGLGPGDYFGIVIPEETLTSYILETKSHGMVIDDFELGWKYTKTILPME